MFRSGDQIGPYVLKAQIGRGAFGVVWLAEETTFLTTHKVALKLPSEASVNTEMIRLEAARRALVTSQRSPEYSADHQSLYFRQTDLHRQRIRARWFTR
jgi:hypothetical protein